MTTPTERAPRRVDALSRDRIVRAAIEILDTGGDAALTVRALGAHLSTGRGAIYHHVPSMEELLAAAADDVLGNATQMPDIQAKSPSSIRDLALDIFDLIDAHPWVGAQLARQPLQPAVFRMWKLVGRHLEIQGLTGIAAFTAGAALVNYILGAVTQHAAGPRRVHSEAERLAFLEKLSEAWADHDADALVQEAALHLPHHSDREQFLAGVDIFLAGIRQSAPQ